MYSCWFQSCSTSTDFLHYQKNNIIKTQSFQLFPNLNMFSDFQEKTGSLVIPWFSQGAPREPRQAERDGVQKKTVDRLREEQV